MNNRTIYYLLLLLFPVLPLSSSGLQDSIFHFRSFEESFPNRPVIDFTFDDSGFLWIGTYGAGIYRFDGITYEGFNLEWENENSLNSDFILSLLKDSHGQLWVGTERGLNYFDKSAGVFRRTSFLTSTGSIFEPGGITVLLEDGSGNLLLGTSNYGVIFLSADQLINPKNIELVKPAEAGQSVVNDLVIDRQGRIYVATEAGLRRYNYETKQLVDPITSDLFSNINDPVKSLLIDPLDGLWIGTNFNGLRYVEKRDSDQQWKEAKHYPLTDKRIMDLEWSQSGELLCATENDGLLVIKPDQPARNFRTDHYSGKSIESNSIWSLLMDESGRLWLGYYNKGIGLRDPDASKFDNLIYSPQNKNTPASNSINALALGKDGVIWVGSDGGGVDKYFVREKRFVHLNEENGYTGLTNLSVQAVFLDHLENLWVGTWGGGVFKLPKGEKQFQQYTVESTNGQLKSNRILSFAEDGAGTIWIGTFGAGLYAYSPTTDILTHQVSLQFQNFGIPTKDIRSLLVDRRDRLWIGSTSGLFCLSTRQGTEHQLISYTNRREADNFHPSFNHVLSLYEDNEQNIWIGTDGAGLYQYQKNIDSFIQHGDQNELVQQTICGIVKEQSGNIWVSGKKGISRIKLPSGAITNFSRADGLLSNDFNYGAALAEPNGVLYFGNQLGIDYLDPLKLKMNEEPVKLYLTGLQLFNKTVQPGSPGAPLNESLSQLSELVLSHHQSVFTINYTGLNFTRPEGIQFAYYLEGLETDWKYVGNLRAATYTSLQEGNYTFRLKAANNDGLWTEEPIELSIVILPPWHRSRFAYVTYIFFFLAGLYLFYFLMKMRIRERQEAATERERHRERELLSQSKFQFFTNISHEFRTPLTLILNPLQDVINKGSLPSFLSQKLLTAQLNATRLSRLINELLDFRKLSFNKLRIQVVKTNTLPLIEEVVGYFAAERDTRNIHFNLSAVDNDYFAWVDPGMFEKILFNLLSNAYKFTPDEGSISLAVDYADNQELPSATEPVRALRISIEDSGPGIAPEEISRIFDRFYQVENHNRSYIGSTGIGLEVVKSFVEMHRGKIEVTSKLGEGTVFNLYFSLDKTHFSPEEILSTSDLEATSYAPLPESSTKVNDEVASGATVLFVDDNAELRDYIGNELRSNYRVRTASNGIEGLKLTRQYLPDLIITDVIMPEMDGFEFCQQLHADKKLSHIPVIMLTAKGAFEDQAAGLEHGADLYLQKPFDINLLRIQINRLLKSRQTLFNKYAAERGTPVPSTLLSDREFMELLMNHVDTNMSRHDLSVDSLATVAHLSRSQLYRRVKSLTQLTANQFIRQTRLVRAQQLIRDGRHSINEIVHLVGFSSGSYFAKCYKKHFGHLPSEEV